MNAARIQQQIEAIRSEVGEKLDALLQVVREETGDGPPPKVLMTITEYADHARVSATTVRRWLEDNIPHRRRGRNIRIIVAEADAWCRAAEIASSAKDAAHRGRP